MNVLILNHYATDTFLDHGGRHYEFAKRLIKAGYDVRVFCASTLHNTDRDLIAGNKLYREDSCDGIPFVFIKARQYKGNGKQRVLNMLDYYMNVQKAAKHFEKPDVIIGSSVHPLACVAAIKLSKRFKCRNIVEIRDMWPESIVAYDIAKKSNPLVKVLYRLEKWIYTKADSIVFTMEGGRDYIVEKGWDKEHGGPVDLNKIYHINNGVDLETFNYNREHYTFADSDLDNPDIFKVVYTGSIRKANETERYIDIAFELSKRNADKIKILIWGTGDQVKHLSERIEELGSSNIVLKGSVEKKNIPYILSRSDLNTYLLADSKLFRFGLSLNKSFEYFASGKPVLTSSNSGYSLIDRYQCGVCLPEYSAEKMANGIMRFAEMSKDEYGTFCTNALTAAREYDFQVLTEKLINILGDKNDEGVLCDKCK